CFSYNTPLTFCCYHTCLCLYFFILFLFFLFFFFFFNDTATTEIYTLSLHDALPIFIVALDVATAAEAERMAGTLSLAVNNFKIRSEEHTSELQSQSNLVCRLLLEKKKKKKKKSKKKSKINKKKNQKQTINIITK